MTWHRLDVFDGRFIISDRGVVVNTTTNTTLSPYTNNKGYLLVDLSCDGERKRCLVHRLVAQAFIPNPDNLPVVMHLDNNTKNPNANNLQWGTYSDNNKQAVREGRMIVPKPDNRKYYILYNPNTGEEIRCNGIKEIMHLNGIQGDSRYRNYIFRNKPISDGNYKGWKIRLEKRSTTIP